MAGKLWCRTVTRCGTDPTIGPLVDRTETRIQSRPRPMWDPGRRLLVCGERARRSNERCVTTVCDGSLLLGKRGSRDPVSPPAQTDQGCKRETRNHRCERKRVGATLHEHTGRRLALYNRVPVPGRKESGECSPHNTGWGARSWAPAPGRLTPCTVTELAVARWAPEAAESQTRKVGAASSAGKGPSCPARQTTEAACDLLTHRQPGRTRRAHAPGHHSRDLLPSLFPCQCAFSSTFYLVRRPHGGAESTRAGGL